MVASLFLTDSNPVQPVVAVDPFDRPLSERLSDVDDVKLGDAVTGFVVLEGEATDGVRSLHVAEVLELAIAVPAGFAIRSFEFGDDSG